MKETMNEHQPVLLAETLANLAIRKDGIYVDATFGRGGHATAILDQLGPAGRLLAMDKDPEAVAYARQHFLLEQRFVIEHGSFAQLEPFLIKQQVHGKVNGILFDLGVSSPQLDDAARGFSFMRPGRLDMRMDNSQGTDAAAWLASATELELTRVLWEYGEERFARRVAKAILLARQDHLITTTEELSAIIARAVPFKEKNKHPATRSFQAIRIAVNHELEELEQGLVQGLTALASQGRLLVISFHSLEDRIVKHFMRQQEYGHRLPAKLPVKHVHHLPEFKQIGRAIKPAQEELNKNIRARSAILRVGEKQL
jgi:16S rRNA (cytosine1402-N4)-methyltransferase